jgi:hypothetical protein
MAAERSAIDVASTYLDALVSQDADGALLAPDVRRLKKGQVLVEGAEAIRDILRREPLAGAGDRRWVVDGEHAVVFYDIDADIQRANGAAGAPDTWIPTYIAERFLVRDGLVHEIDPVFFADMAKNPHPERPVRYPEGDDARDVVIGVAQSYLDSLLSHDASAVPLAEHAYRIENGVYMGNTGAEIRAALEDPSMDFLDRIEDVRWYAAPGSAVAFYTLYVDAGDAGEVVCTIGERFRVFGGELVEIEVVIATEMAP